MRDEKLPSSTSGVLMQDLIIYRRCFWLILVVLLNWWGYFLIFLDTKNELFLIRA